MIWHNHMSQLCVSSFLWKTRKWKSRFKSWESSVPYFALRWMSPLSKVCGTSLRNWEGPTDRNETRILFLKKELNFTKNDAFKCILFEAFMKELIHVSHPDFKFMQVEKSVIPGETSGGWAWCNTLVLKMHRVFLAVKGN